MSASIASANSCKSCSIASAWSGNSLIKIVCNKRSPTTICLISKISIENSANLLITDEVMPGRSIPDTNIKAVKFALSGTLMCSDYRLIQG